MGSKNTPGQDKNSIAERTSQAVKTMLRDAREKHEDRLHENIQAMQVTLGKEGCRILWDALTKGSSDETISELVLQGTLVEGAVLRRRAERRHYRMSVFKVQTV